MLLFIVAPVIIWKGSYIYAIYGWGVVSILSFFIAIYFKNIPFKNVTSTKASLNFKEVLSYSLPLVGASLAGLAITSSYQFYISRYFGTDVFAEYSNGFTPIPFVGMITGATSVVLMPQFTKMIYEKANVDKLLVLWREALYKSAVLIYPLVIFIFFNAKNIIIFLFSSTYENSVIYFKIAIFTNFLNIIVFAPLLLSLGESKFYSRIHWINAALAWIGGYLIVTYFPKPEYIAAFSVLLNIVMMFFSFPRISKILGIRVIDLFPLKKIFIILVHSFSVFAVILLIDTKALDSFSIIVRLGINFIIYLFLLILTQSIFKIDYLIFIKTILPVKAKVAKY
jgi:O-antigen/teichoic acid export membrane protein